MGVLIKDMEMPKDCKDCIFCVNNWCVINSRLHHIKGAEETTQYCPIIPVPPHGRLIDADALIKDGWTLHKEVIRMGGYATHELPLNNPSIPTIIEAAEGE